MCLGIPGEIESIDDHDSLSGARVGLVRFGGVKRNVCLECVPDAVVGDFVLVHVGFAIARLDAAEAERTYAILRELADADFADDDTAPQDTAELVSS